MSDDKVIATQSEQPVPKKGKRKTCMRHCKRFWWIYLIVFICAVVLIVCLLIFVGVPNLAQKKLDASELEVDGIHVTQTRENSYHMAINSTIRSGGGVQATIREFTADMYLEDLEPHTPFVELHFPETTSAELQTVNTSKAVEIQDMDAFATFNTWLLGNESVRVTIKGDTAVRVSGISRWFDVTYKKTMTLKGLNHFKGLAVTESDLSLTPDDNGDNFRGFVDIPNPSVLTIEIGNASFYTYLENERVGTTYIDNLTLYPGINNASLRANISRVPVLSAASSRPGCEEGIIDFVLGGRRVENQGDILPYFTKSLSASNLTVPIDIGTALENLLGERPTCGNSTSTEDEDED